VTLPERLEDIKSIDLRALDDLELTAMDYELKTLRRDLRAEQTAITSELERRERFVQLNLDTLTPQDRAELLAFLQGQGPNPGESRPTP
jgi:hypothetical protein